MTFDQPSRAIAGMDCAHDAAEIEDAVRESGVADGIRVSVSSGLLSVRLIPRASAVEVMRAADGIGYWLELLDDEPGGTSAHASPAYRRAFWTVVLLNVGYGVVESAGGIISGSQALKADVLDFLGDGLITLPGIVVAVAIAALFLQSS